MNIKRILLVRGGAIGDFIVTLPVLAALRRRYPLAHLEILGHPPVAQLAVAAGLAAAVHSLEAPGLATFFVPGADLDAGYAGYFARFTLIVSFLHDPAGTFQANVARCSAGRFLAGPHRPTEAAGLPAAAALLQPLEQLGVVDPDSTPALSLTVPPSARLAPGRWLGLHPGSGSELKNWPESKWVELLRRLYQFTPWNFLFIAGEAEGDRVERLARRANLPPTRCCLVQNRPLLEVAHRLIQCQAYIGHDSGISHLAAALGLRGLLLWGPTNEAVWRPRSVRMALVRHPAGLQELPVETVWQSLHTGLPDDSAGRLAKGGQGVSSG